MTLYAPSRQQSFKWMFLVYHVPTLLSIHISLGVCSRPVTLYPHCWICRISYIQILLFGMQPHCMWYGTFVSILFLDPYIHRFVRPIMVILTIDILQTPELSLTISLKGLRLVSPDFTQLHTYLGYYLYTHVGVLGRQFQLNMTVFVPAFKVLVVITYKSNPPFSCLCTYRETCRTVSIIIIFHNISVKFIQVCVVDCNWIAYVAMIQDNNTV